MRRRWSSLMLGAVFASVGVIGAELWVLTGEKQQQLEHLFRPIPIMDHTGAELGLLFNESRATAAESEFSAINTPLSGHWSVSFAKQYDADEQSDLILKLLGKKTSAMARARLRFQWSESEQLSLLAALFPMTHGGRGLSNSAAYIFGRRPAELSPKELDFLLSLKPDIIYNWAHLKEILRQSEHDFQIVDSAPAESSWLNLLHREMSDELTNRVELLGRLVSIKTGLDKGMLRSSEYVLRHHLSMFGSRLSTEPLSPSIQSQPPTEFVHRAGSIWTGKLIEKESSAWTIESENAQRTTCTIDEPGLERFAQLLRVDRSELNAAIPLNTQLQVSSRHFLASAESVKTICDVELDSELFGNILLTRKGLVLAVSGNIDPDGRNVILDQHWSTGSYGRLWMADIALRLGWKATDLLDNSVEQLRDTAIINRMVPPVISLAWSVVGSQQGAQEWLLRHLLDQLDESSLRGLSSFPAQIDAKADFKTRLLSKVFREWRLQPETDPEERFSAQILLDEVVEDGFQVWTELVAQANQCNANLAQLETLSSKQQRVLLATQPRAWFWGTELERTSCGVPPRGARRTTRVVELIGEDADVWFEERLRLSTILELERTVRAQSSAFRGDHSSENEVDSDVLVEHDPILQRKLAELLVSSMQLELDHDDSISSLHRVFLRNLKRDDQPAVRVIDALKLTDGQLSLCRFSSGPPNSVLMSILENVVNYGTTRRYSSDIRVNNTLVPLMGLPFTNTNSDTVGFIGAFPGVSDQRWNASEGVIASVLLSSRDQSPLQARRLSGTGSSLAYPIWLSLMRNVSRSTVTDFSELAEPEEIGNVNVDVATGRINSNGQAVITQPAQRSRDLDPRTYLVRPLPETSRKTK